MKIYWNVYLLDTETHFWKFSKCPETRYYQLNIACPKLSIMLHTVLSKYVILKCGVLYYF